MSGGISMIDVYQTVRTRMLTCADAGGNMLSTTFTGSPAPDLYIEKVPANAAFPYGVLSLQLQTDPRQSGIRADGEMELMMYTRPISALAALSAAADLALGAMTGYSDRTSGGVIHCIKARRTTVPSYGDPADREMCAVRLVFTLTLYPVFLALHPTP
jgi:hypothetical protein